VDEEDGGQHGQGGDDRPCFAREAERFSQK
jgi:hypothetical protein